MQNPTQNLQFQSFRKWIYICNIYLKQELLLIDMSFVSFSVGIACEKLDDRKVRLRGYSFSNLGDNQDDFAFLDSEFDTVKSLSLNTRCENFSHHFLNNPIK